MVTHVTHAWRTGQKVRHSTAWMADGHPDKLTNGMVYTVVRPADGGIMVVADDGVERLYRSEWFIPADAPAAPAEAHDPVQRPSHYSRFPVEPITFIMLNDLPFAEGNVIKYVCRWRYKNGVEDLKKARRQLDMLIEAEERKAAGDFDPKKVL